ncbi:TRAP transporter large permease [Tropicibacter sp. R15_0]|uniref:TRAP transporter large permease n=1 Tax=Tropicibacter sp. R15_0 TaxID=2821101 RepID=UPI001ADB89BD|nr:TRAP transporter large permease [Tropicibacter sp. R15_0]MBO9464226.1 TRAP transporter large permease [Tropicibacter sp. R15_0]
METMILLALLAALILLALGIPIYLVLMGLASALLVAEGRTIAGLGQHVLDHLQSPILISVPFFILSAVLMQGGGLARVLFDAALAWIGWIRGGLAIAGVAATAVFAAITGSSAATTMAMGTLLVPLMEEKGYKTSFAMGLTAAAGTLGILIPPSLPMILFGLIAEESIPRLFLGGVIPGLMQAGLFAAYIFFVANKVGGKAEPRVSRKEFVNTNVHAFPAYLIPIVVLGGIYGGFVTLTEAAVLGVLCALIAVLFIYRSARLRDIPGMLTQAVDRTSVIVLIIMGATLVSAWIIKSGVPQSFAASIVESDMKPWQFLLIMNGCLLVLGMFLEGVAIILIVLPVVFVVVRQLGIDMTHFAVVMVINIELALLSPPIGLNLFVMSNVAGRPVLEVLRGTIPFFLIMLGLLMAVTFFPALSTWLPNLVLGS